MVQAVIRLRSDINVKPNIKKTLHLLRLNKVNHCILIQNNPVNDGMLKKIKDYVTWGEIKPEVLARLIVTRGRLVGNKPIKPEYIKAETRSLLRRFGGASVEPMLAAFVEEQQLSSAQIDRLRKILAEKSPAGDDIRKPRDT